MRLSISHRTTYLYTPPAARVIQVLRLTPRNHDGQYVVNWRIDVSADCRLDQHEDAFGNITHVFAAEGPLPELSLLVEGEIETRDAQGIVRDAVERFQPSLFLRETELTACDDAIAAYAAAARQADSDTLPVLHRLLDGLHEEMRQDEDPTYVATAAEASGSAHARPSLSPRRSLGIRRAMGGICPASASVRSAWAETRSGSRLSPIRQGDVPPCPMRASVGSPSPAPGAAKAARGGSMLAVDIHVARLPADTRRAGIAPGRALCRKAVERS